MTFPLSFSDKAFDKHFRCTVTATEHFCICSETITEWSIQYSSQEKEVPPVV